MSALGQLVAGIAHEVNNPISFIFGNLAPASEYINDLIYVLQSYRQFIVDKHQGQLEFQSTLGEGTEFIITLPIRRQKFNFGANL